MWHGREKRGVQPPRPDGEALGVTARAEVPAFAGEREQVFVRACVAADAREAVLQHTAGEELVGDLRHDGPPRAVLAGEAILIHRLQPMQVIRYQPKQRRRDDEVTAVELMAVQVTPEENVSDDAKSHTPRLHVFSSSDLMLFSSSRLLTLCSSRLLTF